MDNNLEIETNDNSLMKTSKEKLSVRFENLSIDNDTDLTDTDEIEGGTFNKFSSDYFTNEEFFLRDDLIKLAEDVIGERASWRNQDIDTLKEMLRNCKNKISNYFVLLK